MIMVVNGNIAGEMLKKIIEITQKLLSLRRIWLNKEVNANQKMNLVEQLNKLMLEMAPLLESVNNRDMEKYKNHEKQFIQLTKEYVVTLSQSNITNIKRTTVEASLDNIDVSGVLKVLWMLPGSAYNRLSTMKNLGKLEKEFVTMANELEQEIQENFENLNVNLNEVDFTPIFKKVSTLQINGKKMDDQNYSIMLITKDESLTFEFDDEKFVSRVFAMIGNREEDIKKEDNKYKITSKGEDMKIDCTITKQLDEEEEDILYIDDEEEDILYIDDEEDQRLKLEVSNSVKPPPPPPPPASQLGGIQRTILTTGNTNNEQQDNNEAETKVLKKGKPETTKKQKPPGNQKSSTEEKLSHNAKSLESLEDNENQFEEEVSVAAKSKITFKKSKRHEYRLEEVRKGTKGNEAVPALNGGKDFVVIKEDQSIELDKNEILTVTIYEENGMRYKECYLKGVKLISTKSLEDIPGSVRLKFKLLQETEEGEVSFAFEEVKYDIAFYYESNEIDGYMSWDRTAYLAKKREMITLKNTSVSDLIIQCVWPNDMAMYFDKESNVDDLLEFQKVKLPKGGGFNFTFIPNNNNMKQGINTFIWKIQIYNNANQKLMNERAFRIITENNPQEHKDERKQPEGNDRPIVQKIKELDKKIKSEQSTIGIYNAVNDWVNGFSGEDLEWFRINNCKNLLKKLYFKITSSGEGFGYLWEQPLNQMKEELEKMFLHPFKINFQSKYKKYKESMADGLSNIGKKPGLKGVIETAIWPMKNIIEIMEQTIYIKEDEGQKEFLRLKRTIYGKKDLAAGINELKKNDSKKIEKFFVECIKRNNPIDEKTLMAKGFNEDDIKKLRENRERAKEKTISHHNKKGKKGLRFLKRLNEERKIKDENGKTQFSAMAEPEKTLEVVKEKKVELSKLSDYSNDVILSREFMVITGIAKVSDVRSSHGQICKILIVTCEGIVKKQEKFNSIMLKKIKKTKHLDVAIRLMICYVILHYGFPKLFGTDIAPLSKCNSKINYIWRQVVKMPKLKNHIDDNYVAGKLDWKKDTKIGGFAQVHGGLRGDINSVGDLSSLLKVLANLNVATDLLAPFKDLIGTYVGLPLTINSIADIIEKNKLIIGKESSLGEVLHGLDLISQRFDNSSMIDQLIIKD